MTSLPVTVPAAQHVTSQQANVPEIQVSTSEERSPVESCVRSSAAVAGLVAATGTGLLSDVSCTRSKSTGCLVFVDSQSPSAGKCDDVGGQSSVESPLNSERVGTVGVSKNRHVEAAKSAAEPSRPCGRLGRALNWLTVGGRRQAAATQRCQSWTGCTRRVVIDSSLSVRHRRRQAATNSVYDEDHEDDDDDRPSIHQFATSITSTELRDGTFTARLPVDVMPRGDVTIRMRNGRLEVLQRELSEVEEQLSPGRLYGVLALPMYVDTDSVSVQHDALQQSLVINASTKASHHGATLRRRSLSLDDLRRPRGRKIAQQLGSHLMWSRKRRQHNTVILCSDTQPVVSSRSNRH